MGRTIRNREAEWAEQEGLLNPLEMGRIPVRWEGEDLEATGIIEECFGQPGREGSPGWNTSERPEWAIGGGSLWKPFTSPGQRAMVAGLIAEGEKVPRPQGGFRTEYTWRLAVAVDSEETDTLNDGRQVLALPWKIADGSTHCVWIQLPNEHPLRVRTGREAMAVRLIPAAFQGSQGRLVAGYRLAQRPGEPNPTYIAYRTFKAVYEAEDHAGRVRAALEARRVAHSDAELVETEVGYDPETDQMEVLTAEFDPNTVEWEVD